MFELVRKLIHKDTAGEPPQVRVLAVTQNASDWRTLQEIANGRGWALFWAHSRESALAILSHYAIPIVICDRDLPGEDWRDVVKHIAGFRPPVSILLASSVSDEYLWREVVQHSGFDVLPKPFRDDNVIRAVNTACVAMSGGLTPRRAESPPQAEGLPHKI